MKPLVRSVFFLGLGFSGIRVCCVGLVGVFGDEGFRRLKFMGRFVWVFLEKNQVTRPSNTV